MGKARAELLKLSLLCDWPWPLMRELQKLQGWGINVDTPDSAKALTQIH